MKFWGALTCASFSLVAACTDTRLERAPEAPPPPVDNLITVDGEFCTDSPSSVEFPVKILFIVDVSDSMTVTDPPDPADNNYTSRTRAVIDVINSLAGIPGVEIGIISFQSSINDLTSGFVKNFEPAEVARLIMFAQTLNNEAGQTNYEGALEAAFRVLLADISAADETRRSRSKYSVIFLSDGLPEPVDPPNNTPESVVELVENLRRLERERRLAELRVHTVYLSGRTPPQFQQPPVDLLRDMASAGSGTFRNIGNGEKINFLDIGFTAFRRVFQLKSFLVENINARPRALLASAADSDGDGLGDEEEVVIGTSETSTDTDDDGFSDRLENELRNAGFDPLDGSDADCRITATDRYNRGDEDGDGLLNCEERFLGTNPRLFDTDADGIPDANETRARVSATSDDYFFDSDRDGVPNGFEIRDRSDPIVDDRDDFSKLRYVYDLDRVEVRESQVCYRFEVENIALSSALAMPGANSGWNQIRVSFGQTAADTPTDFGEFKVACARARFVLEDDLKEPVRGRISFDASDFKRTSNFDDPNDATVFNAERDCKDPGDAR